MQRWFAIHSEVKRKAHLYFHKPDQMHLFCVTYRWLNWFEEEFPQYLEILHSAYKWDVKLAGEFLVMQVTAKQFSIRMPSAWTDSSFGNKGRVGCGNAIVLH